MTKTVTGSVEQFHQRIGRLERQQIIAWQKMSPVQRLEIAFQAYQFALEAVRLTERQRHPNLSQEEFNWRVIRRMQGNQKLGRKDTLESDHTSRVE
jgi:hypothetical protein